MSGSSNRKTCCDWECAEANYCVIGGIQCEGCGLYFCARDLNEYGYCEECERQKAEEEMEEDEDE